MSLNEKHQNILQLLAQQTNWITSNTIADALQISVRSVKYSLSEIEADHPRLVLSSNRGYRVDKERAASLLLAGNATPAIPRNYEERKRYIIHRLLLENQRRSITELSEKLCISPVTLQNELSRMRQELTDFHLNIHTKNDYVTITGLAKDKRRVVMILLNEEVQNSFFSIEKIQPIFTTVNLKQIEKMIVDTLSKYEYFLDEYGMLNYVLHIALTIELQNDQSHTEKKTEKMEIFQLGSPHVLKIVNDLYLRLKEVYPSNYQVDDIFEASLLMMTRALSNQVGSLQYGQLEGILSSEIQQLMADIIRSVENTYGINLSRESFQIRFSFHLKNLLDRLQYNIRISNLQLHSIKNDYPLIFAISVHISNLITNHTGHRLPEDEIAYIALHIGVLIEENKALNDKVKCVVICPDYLGVGKALFKKLSTVFSESMLVTNVVTSSAADTDFTHTDLLLTTVPVEPSPCPYTMQLKPFLSEEDIRALFTLLDHIKIKKIKDRFRKKILYFFHQDLFFADVPFASSTDVIELMCDKMIYGKYVDPAYKDEIYDHEKLSSSSYGNIAIPHPLNNKAKTSVIAIAVCPQSIPWGMNQVNLVFMLSLKEEDKELFSDIFEFITKVIKEENTFRKMLKVRDFDEFINILVSVY